MHLHAYLRNDMKQAFLDLDCFVAKPQKPEHDRHAEYWTVEFAIEGIELLPDESLTSIVTAVAGGGYGRNTIAGDEAG
ncbi:MAG: hypothetical protein IPK99_03925 [Flavobacteriales bacterium]|nr:hypothetical protein [Flavobacteriales bacterium]